MQRKNIMVLMISLSLVLLLGSSYALLRSSQVGSNPYVINVGNLQVTFVDSETEFLNLTNMYPMSDKEGSSQDKELSFMVENTGNVDSYYDVTLEETSTNPEFKSVIRYIINKDEKGYNQPKTLGEDKFIEVGGYLKPNESSSYKVKVWLDYNADNTYMNKEFKAKVVVNSFQESNYAKDVIKSKLVKYEESSKDDFQGGLVAVNTNGELYNETDASQELREYRYSGPSVNNYVTFNDELWRIIGVFSEEGEEFVKIVKNEYLNSDVFPLNYNLNNLTYQLKSQETDDVVFWNNNNGENTNRNDWSKAGLMYFLNTDKDELDQNGYQFYLSNDAKNMIRETIYYLGNVTFLQNNTCYGIDETAISAYKNERATTICQQDITNNSQDNNCYIWHNNNITWKGKIGLMYPSDIAYSSNSSNWNTYKLLSNQMEKSASSWIKTSFVDKISQFYWLISPTSSTNYYASAYRRDNNNYIFGDRHSPYLLNDRSSVHPALYLKSNVKITSGIGEKNNPYTLELN